MEFDFEELMPLIVSLNLLISFVILIFVILIFRQRTFNSSLTSDESAKSLGNGGVTICKNCMQSYPATLKKCPHCGTKR